MLKRDTYPESYITEHILIEYTKKKAPKIVKRDWNID